MIGSRILGKLRGRSTHEVGLRDESIESLRNFWNRSAITDAEAAVAFGVDDFWQSGASELDMLRPYLAPDGIVLEIGCGIGRITRHVAAHCAELHGIDISEEMIRKAGVNLREFQNVRLHVGNGFSLPFPDKTFDFLYSCRVFQHIPKNIVLNYLKEAFRVLKPGAKFLLEIPNLLLDEHMQALNHFSTLEYFEKPYPMYFYTEQEIVRMGTFVGFEVAIMGDWFQAVLTKPSG